MKRTAPVLLACAAGWVMVVAYFVPRLEWLGDTAATWFAILSAVAFILGGGNLLRMNLRQIARQEKGWGYAAVTAVSFLVTVTVGLLKAGVPREATYPDAAWGGDFLAEGSALWWLLTYVINPATATMYGMLAFFVASAAFRAFRAKNLDAAVLLTAAIIVLLGQVYAGAWLTAWLPPAFRLPAWKEYIVDVFNTAGMRTLTIGIALGLAATAIRVLLGLDQSYVGADD